MNDIIIPEPVRSGWLGRFACKASVQIPLGASGLTQPCDEHFWFYAHYEVHWLLDHAPSHPLPRATVEEEGRMLASRRDDLISLGVPPGMLEIPLATKPRYEDTYGAGLEAAFIKALQDEGRASREPMKRPFNVKDALVVNHGEQWAPRVINVDGVNYIRNDIDRKDT